MRQVTWIGILAFIGGIWTGISPFLTGSVPLAGNIWTRSVVVTVITGAVIALAALVGLIGAWSQWFKEIDRRPSSKRTGALAASPRPRPKSVQ